jgi:hypothetical protein
VRRLHTFLAVLTTTYLLIPAFLFAWGWLRWYYALLTSVLGIAFLAYAILDLVHALRSSEDAIPLRDIWRSLWPGLLIVTVWMYTSGVGGFGRQNADYYSHNALLKALIAQPWPLKIDFEGQIVNYVYYLGYYLPVAGIGKLIGWNLANVFGFFWALLGVLLAYLWFWRVSGLKEKKITSIVLAVIFCLASGMDVIGYYLFFHNPFEWGVHMETWADIFQYTSQTALIFWVPQHTIAAWLVAGLTLTCLDDPRLFRYLGMAVAASILWSPFGALGITPYLLILFIVLLVRKQFKALFNPASLLLNISALWIAAIYLLYISSNQYSFPIGLLWNIEPDHKRYIATTLGFWCLEFASQAIVVTLLLAFVARARKRDPALEAGSKFRWGWFVLVCLVLLVLPIFKMGYSNDLVMRGSIPSLFYLWAFICQALVQAAAYLKFRSIKIVHALLVCFLLIGSYTSFSEIGRSVYIYHFGPPDITDVREIASATYPHIVAQRIGVKDTFFYHHLSR